MTWLLDTNVVSEFAKPRPDEAVLDWIADRDPQGIRCHVSAVTVAEIHRGIALLNPPHPRRETYVAWLEGDFRQRFAGRILPFDERVAAVWGPMAAALPKAVALPIMDSLLAATALCHDVALVTRNVRDFRHFTGLKIENPWGAAA